jgi:hypothetical protein
MSRYYLAACTLLLGMLSACSGPGGNRPTDRPTRTAIRPPWQLIGLKIDEAEVQAYVSQLSSQPDREEAPGYGVFLSLHRDGVELSADTEGTITTVIIYGSPSEQYDEYAGPMPRSLTWDMTRGDVEKALGKPADDSFTRNSVTGRWEYYAEYPELDMYLNYNAQSESDMQAKLIDIRIKNARL